MRIAAILAPWSRITNNPDVSTGPLTHPFARSLAPLTFSRAGSLTHSRAHGTVNDWMAFFVVLYHSAMVKREPRKSLLFIPSWLA